MKINSNGILETYDISECSITENLIAWYPLDGSAIDLCGNYDGTVSGAVVAQGLGQLAYSFSYTTDNIVIGNASSFPATNALTLSAWVKSNNISRAQNIISRNGPYFLRITNSTIKCCVYTGTWFMGNGSTTLSSNTWYHLVLTYDGSNVRGYVNGVQDLVGAKTGNLTSFSSTRIGYTTGGEDAPFDGLIQDVRIYNRALSPEEVGILYKTTGHKHSKMEIFNNKVYLAGNLKEV